MTAHITYQSTCLATCSGSQGALSASASGLLPPSSSGPHAGSALPSAPGPMYPGPASQDSSHGPPGQGVDLQHQWQASHWAPHHQAPGIPSPPSLVILPHVTALTTMQAVVFWYLPLCHLLAKRRLIHRFFFCLTLAALDGEAYLARGFWQPLCQRVAWRSKKHFP